MAGMGGKNSIIHITMVAKKLFYNTERKHDTEIS
jgi:hypothetical protein